MKKITFKKGNKVTWASQAGGFETTKEGKIVYVLPADCFPLESGKTVKGARMPRDHESYIIQVGEKFYWPRVSYLSKVLK